MPQLLLTLRTPISTIPFEEQKAPSWCTSRELRNKKPTLPTNSTFPWGPTQRVERAGLNSCPLTAWTRGLTPRPRPSLEQLISVEGMFCHWLQINSITKIAERVVLSQVIPIWLWSGCTPSQFFTTTYPRKTHVSLQQEADVWWKQCCCKIKVFTFSEPMIQWGLALATWSRNLGKCGALYHCYYFFMKVSGFLKSFSMTLRVQAVQFSDHKTKKKKKRGRTGPSSHGWLDKEPCFMLCTRIHDKNVLLLVVPYSRLAPAPSQEVWQCICSLTEWHPWRMWRHC